MYQTNILSAQIGDTIRSLEQLHRSYQENDYQKLVEEMFQVT